MGVAGLLLAALALTGCSPAGFSGTCTPGDIPVGDVGTVNLDGTEVQLVGGECFDLVDLSTPLGLPRTDHERVRDEFCARLGFEPQLSAIFGHGSLSVAFADSGVEGPDYVGNCLYGPPLDATSEGPVQVVNIGWNGLDARGFDTKVSELSTVTGMQPQPLNGPGTRAVAMHGPTLAMVIVTDEEPDGPGFGTVAYATASFSPGQNSSQLDDLLRRLAGAALDRGNEIFAQSGPP